MATVKLTWDHSGVSCDGFKIFRKLSSSSTYTSMGTVAAAQRTYSDASATIGATYTYKVLAYNIGGDSDPMETTVTVTVPAPAPVSNLSAEVLP